MSTSFTLRPMTPDDGPAFSRLLLAAPDTGRITFTLHYLGDPWESLRARQGDDFLGVVAEMAERVAVMYTGMIVGEAPVKSLFSSPQHPYTIGLLRSIPRIGDRDQQRRRRLHVIPGTVPDLRELPRGCTFQERCPEVRPICGELPPLEKKPSGHLVRCWMR
jgi:oligopeptide/dipeptide ABC transporter ATP-binding protein